MQPRFLEHVTKVETTQQTQNGGLFDGEDCEYVRFNVDENYFYDESKIKSLAEEIVGLIDGQFSLIDQGRILNSHLYAISGKGEQNIGGIGMIGYDAFGTVNSRARFYYGGVHVMVFFPNPEYSTSLYQQLNPIFL